MRLNRLDLIRYGRFNDAQIVLPSPAGDTPDVTLIYGPNESGKSTAFKGFLELLFGMQVRNHPYTFRFERSNLLVGAELDIPGRGPTILRRNSKSRLSLQDDQGRPVDEALLSGALHGLGQDTYLERFSLDDTGLRSGGERIADAKGDLGQLLHAGVSGLTNIARVLAKMEDQADKFHRKGGRSTTLKEGKNRLAEIRRTLNEDLLTPARERKLSKARDDASKVFEAADSGLREARHRQAAGKAAQVWYDQSAEMQRIEEALSLYPNGPDLPKGANEQAAALVATISQKSERITEAEDSITLYRQIISENKADLLAPDLEQELKKLDQLEFDGAPLISRADTAEADLRNRIDKRDKLEQRLAQTLTALKAPDVPASSFVLTPEELETLSNAAQACETSENAVTSAKAILQNAKDQAGKAPAKPKDLTQLTAVWSRWQTLTDPSPLTHAVDTERARLERAIVGLPETWSGLVRQGLPPRETLQAVLQEWNGLNSAITTAVQNLDECEMAYAKAVAKREVDEITPASIDIAETMETRRLRDVAWSEHRGALSEHSADFFEEAMRKDDGAHTNFLMGTEARKQLETSRHQEAERHVRLETAQKKHLELKNHHTELSSRIKLHTIALGLPEDTCPTSFIDRHSTLMAAAEILADVTKAERELAATVKQKQETFDDLTSAAKSAGIMSDQSNLAADVSRMLTLQDSVIKAWSSWQQTAKSIENFEMAVSEAETKKDAAFDRSTALAAPLPLTSRSPSSIKEALPHLRSLERDQTEYEDLNTRIVAMERALKVLEQGASQIAALIDDTDMTADNPVAIINKARMRVANAARADEKRQAEEVRLSKEKQIRDRAVSEKKLAQAELDRLFENQGQSELPPLERISQLAERDAYRTKLATIDASRKQARRGVAEGLFDEELQWLPSAIREAELQQKLDDAQGIRDKKRDEAVEQERLYRVAFDAADNSDLITEQATLLEELRTGARQAAVSRLGALAARSALHRLASERRSTMLEDVEQAFVTMTSNEWKGVRVWNETQGEKLVGIKPDGTSVPVERMSTGTMGQLYFALRLAGYLSFARDPGPLPMILDDIMETFDDSRASAALKLCAEIGKSGQAIIFTHHKHLVTLAQETISGVAIVQMPE